MRVWKVRRSWLGFGWDRLSSTPIKIRRGIRFLALLAFTPTLEGAAAAAEIEASKVLGNVDCCAHDEFATLHQVQAVKVDELDG
jgi:hypothetical protein